MGSSPGQACRASCLLISGPMMLFVNDAIGLLPWWDYFYANNRGGPGQVEIAKVTNAAAGTSASGAR